MPPSLQDVFLYHHHPAPRAGLISESRFATKIRVSSGFNLWLKIIGHLSRRAPPLATGATPLPPATPKIRFAITVIEI